MSIALSTLLFHVALNRMLIYSKFFPFTGGSLGPGRGPAPAGDGGRRLCRHARADQCRLLHSEEDRGRGHWGGRVWRTGKLCDVGYC